LPKLELITLTPVLANVQGGRVLVHGIDGLNRSAAVVLAFAMSSVVCTMEEAVFYLQVLRPHLHVNNN
jgi:protein-tyrosine phosphatase